MLGKVAWLLKSKIMADFEFSTAKRVVWEAGATSNIVKYCEELGIRNPMLVTDIGLLKAGVVDIVSQPLIQAGIEPLIYSDIEPDPPEKIVLKAIQSARENRVDGVIGLGGGSSLDVAKLIAVLIHSKQGISDLYGINQVRGDRTPLILLPTTAGTGSEVTPISIITTGETTKSGVVSPQLLPDIAVLDAELTLGLPSHVTAATGIDSMVHAIEAYTSKIKKNIYSDMLAHKALQIMSENIVEAVENGKNIEARSNMLLGAMMAGQAFANAPVAAVHALAYPLGGFYHIPHGLSNSLVLPYVLKFNAEQAEDLYAELLPSVSKGKNTQSGKKGCSMFLKYIDELIVKIKLPRKLSELNVPESDLPMLADEAMLQQRLLVNNPRVVLREDALAIYQSAY